VPLPGIVGSMDGLGRTALGEDLAEAAGEDSRGFLEPVFASASSFAIFSPELSLASLGRLAAVNPCRSHDAVKKDAIMDCTATLEQAKP